MESDRKNLSLGILKEEIASRTGALEQQLIFTLSNGKIDSRKDSRTAATPLLLSLANGTVTTAKTLARAVTDNRAVQFTGNALGLLVVNPVSKAVASVVTDAIKTTATSAAQLMPTIAASKELTPREKARIALLNSIIERHEGVKFSDFLDDNDKVIFDYIFDLFSTLYRIQFVIDQLLDDKTNPDDWLFKMGHLQWSAEKKAKLPEKTALAQEAKKTFDQAMTAIADDKESQNIQALLAIHHAYEQLAGELHAMRSSNTTTIENLTQMSRDLSAEQKALEALYKSIAERIGKHHRVLRELVLNRILWETVAGEQAAIQDAITDYQRQYAAFKARVTTFNQPLKNHEEETLRQINSYAKKTKPLDEQSAVLTNQPVDFVGRHLEQLINAHHVLTHQIMPWKAQLSGLLNTLFPEVLIVEIKNTVFLRLKSQAARQLQLELMSALSHYFDENATDEGEPTLAYAADLFIQTTLPHMLKKENYTQPLLELMRKKYRELPLQTLLFELLNGLQITPSTPLESKAIMLQYVQANIISSFLMAALRDLEPNICRLLNGLTAIEKITQTLSSFFDRISRDCKQWVAETLEKSTALDDLFIVHDYQSEQLTAIDIQVRAQQCLKTMQQLLQTLTHVDGAKKAPGNGIHKPLERSFNAIEGICHGQYNTVANLLPGINSKKLWDELGRVAKEQLNGISLALDDYLQALDNADIHYKTTQFLAQLQALVSDQDHISTIQLGCIRAVKEAHTFHQSVTHAHQALSPRRFDNLLGPLRSMVAQLKKLEYRFDLKETFNERENVDRLFTKLHAEKVATLPSQPQSSVVRLTHHAATVPGSAAKTSVINTPKPS